MENSAGEGSLAKGYDDASMAIDGMLKRKTSFGAWRERYFRTSLYELSYWSRMVDEIKMTRAVVATHDKSGPYLFAPVGQASETFDLRIPGTEVVAGAKDHLLIEIRLGSKVILDARATDEKEARRWLTVLQRIVAYEKALAARPLGALRVEIDGIYLISPADSSTAGNINTQTKISAHIEFDGQKHEAEGKQARLIENAIYENLHEKDNPVYFAPLTLDTGALPVRRVNDSFGIVLHREATDSVLSSTPSSAATKLFSTSAQQMIMNTKTKLASHRVTLFEVLYLNSKRRRRSSSTEKQKMTNGALCALDGDATDVWPLRAPDGKAAKPGFFLYPILEHDVADDAASTQDAFDGIATKTTAKVVAIVHARIRYWENFLRVVDMDGHDRFEFDGVADDEKVRLAQKTKKDPEAFTTEALMRALDRVMDVADKLNSLADIGFILAFDKPVFSFLVWFLIAFTLLFLPSSASLAFIPLIFVALLLAAALTRDQRRSELFRLSDQDFDTEKRGLRLVRLAILKANEIAPADFDFVQGKATDSDPFVAVMSRPGDNRVRKIEAIAPTLVGITPTRQNTLNPIWMMAEDETLLTRSLGRIIHLGGHRHESTKKKKKTKKKRHSLLSSSSVDKDQPRNLPLLRSQTRRILTEEANTAVRRGLALADDPGRESSIVEIDIDEIAPKYIEHDDDSANGLDATKVPASLMQLLGPDSETCCPAPADFRARWRIALDQAFKKDTEKYSPSYRLESTIEVPKASSWAFPVLQERADIGWGSARRLVPWPESQGTVQLELFDANMTSQQIFLGQAQLPLQKLADHDGRAAIYELPLVPSGDRKRDKAVVSRHLEEAPHLGTITVVAALEHVVSESNDRVEAYKRKLCADVFETKLPTLRKKHTVSTYGNVKDIRRSLKSALQTLEQVASLLERGYCLLTWQYPAKSAVVLAGMLAGVCAIILIPNNLLLFAFISNKMLTGLVKKIKTRLETEPLLIWRLLRSSKDKEADTERNPHSLDPALRLSRPDPSEIQLKNFLKSLPNGPQRDRALANRRYVAAAQHARNQTKARIALNHGLRVNYQNYMYIYHDHGGLTTYWERKYALIVDFELWLYDSMNEALIASSTQLGTAGSSSETASLAAAARKKATYFKLVPPPLGGCWRHDEDVPNQAKQSLPSHSMIIFFLAVYVSTNASDAIQYTIDMTTGKKNKRQLEPAKHLFALKSQLELNDFIRAVHQQGKNATSSSSSSDHPISSVRDVGASTEDALLEEDPATAVSPNSVSERRSLHEEGVAQDSDDKKDQADTNMVNVSIISPNWSGGMGSNVDSLVETFPLLSSFFCSPMNGSPRPNPEKSPI